jgi:hypothetical protein
MEIGPLEYVTIGISDDRFVRDILPELTAIQQSGLIRVVDLLFINKDADGTIRMQEVSELSEEEQQLYEGLAEDLTGLLTTQDIKRLVREIPVGNKAVILLLEHVWTIGLAEAILRAGGTLYTGGIVSPDALTLVGAELAAKEEQHV